MATIPAKIKEIFDELKIEVTWLHGRWIIYQQLFTKSDKRIDLLNQCASVFFYIIQDILLGETQLSLCRLTDEAKSCGKDNLSLEQLQARIQDHGDQQLVVLCRQLLNDLKTKCEPFRTWRDKRLAHLDLATTMQSNLNPLPGISQQMIKEALEAVRVYMNAVEGYYCNSETGYEHFIMSASDAEGLVGILKYGLRYEELLKKEDISHDDWHKGKWHDA